MTESLIVPETDPTEGQKDAELDIRPVDLHAIIELLGEEIDNTRDGIWGNHGAPAAEVHYLVRLIHANADAIENQTGIYAEEPC